MICRFLSQPTMKFFRQANTDHPTPRALHQGKASDSRSKDQANDQSGNGSKRDGHGNTPPIIRPYLCNHDLTMAPCLFTGSSIAPATASQSSSNLGLHSFMLGCELRLVDLMMATSPKATSLIGGRYRSR